MKLRIKLLVIALMLCGITQAQVTKESFEKAVDILNSYSVYYSLSVVSKKDGVINQFKQSCNCENSPDYNTISSSIPKGEEKAIKISTEIEKLKSENITGFSSENIKTFFYSNVFEKLAPLSEFKNDLSKYKEKGKGKTIDKFPDYLNTIKQKIENVLVEEPAPKKKQKDSIDKKNNQSTEKDGKSGFLGGLADYLILLAVLLGATALGLTLRKKHPSYEKMSPKNIDTKEVQPSIQTQSTFNGNTSGDNNDSLKLKELEERISKLESQRNNPTSHMKVVHVDHQYTKQPEAITQMFFLSTPNLEESFNESSASSTYKDGATIYRFTKTESNKATFQIDEKEASVKLALQYPDKNIDPVCEAVNIFNPNATHITTVAQGEAELQGNKWVVTKKAQIRYD